MSGGWIFLLVAVGVMTPVVWFGERYARRHADPADAVFTPDGDWSQH